MMKNKTNVKWKKRAATIVMSLCLLMGLMPIKVFAADSSEQLPVYTIESEADRDYVKRDDLTATFTSSTDFTLGAFQDDWNVYGVKLDYYCDGTPGTPDEGFDILVGFIISLQFTNPTNGSISGEITIPLPSGYDGATARIKDGATAISYNETTVTFPVTLEVYEGNTFTEAFVEYKEKPQHTHSYGDWQKDETNHWRECACDEKTDFAAHSYDNDADTTCNVCSYVRTVALRNHPDSNQLYDMLLDWMDKAVALEAKQISQDEYDQWRYHYPTPGETTHTNFAKVIPQELSDYLLSEDKKNK